MQQPAEWLLSPPVEAPSPMQMAFRASVLGRGGSGHPIACQLHPLGTWCPSSDLAAANSEVPKPALGLAQNLASLMSALITSIPLLGCRCSPQCRDRVAAGGGGGGGPGGLPGRREDSARQLTAARPGSTASYF